MHKYVCLYYDRYILIKKIKKKMEKVYERKEKFSKTKKRSKRKWI